MSIRLPIIHSCHELPKNLGGRNGPADPEMKGHKIKQSNPYGLLLAGIVKDKAWLGSTSGRIKIEKW